MRSSVSTLPTGRTSGCRDSGAAQARQLLDGCRELYCGNSSTRAAELPPHDLEAETVVLSAVLWGDQRASSVRIRTPWLWSADNRCTWAVLLAVEELGDAGCVAWGGCLVRQLLPTCYALGTGPDVELVARALADVGHGPLWYWQHRLRQIMGYGGDVEECARTIRDKARERSLLARMARIERCLRAGEPPDWRVVTDTVAGLLRMRQGHRRRELEDALRGVRHEQDRCCEKG